MELTKKGLAGAVAGTVATVVATALVTWLITTSSAGVDAAERARIKTILEEEFRLDDERTYGQAINSLDKNYAVLTNDFGNFKENFTLMRQAMQSMATDQEEGG